MGSAAGAVAGSNALTAQEGGGNAGVGGTGADINKGATAVGGTHTQQLLTAGLEEGAKAGGSTAALGAPTVVAAAAEQPARIWATAAGDQLELRCLDRFQKVTGEEFRLRVARYVGKGGNATVWEVEKVKHSYASGSSSSSDTQGEGPPACMALKLSYRYCDLKEDQKRHFTVEELAKTNAYAMAMECAIHLKCASCVFITKCYGWGVVTLPDGGQLHGMLLELSKLGSVDKLLVQNGIPCGLDEERAKKIMRGAKLGLQELHLKGRTIHRDLKPSNLLLFGISLEKSMVKLSDLGSGKELHSLGSFAKSVHVGTRVYHPPELLQGYSYDSRMDTWLLGLLLLELCTGFTPFWYLDVVCNTEEEVQARKCPEEMDNPESPYYDCLTAEEKAFVKQCIVVDHRLRPAVKELSSITRYFLW
jgi:serine/threonine protein kinase